MLVGSSVNRLGAGLDIPRGHRWGEPTKAQATRLRDALYDVRFVRVHVHGGLSHEEPNSLLLGLARISVDCCQSLFSGEAALHLVSGSEVSHFESPLKNRGSVILRVCSVNVPCLASNRFMRAACTPLATIFWYQSGG